jgi:pSer/pThr/pTyr-binding forkhead associated (FHA) protein
VSNPGGANFCSACGTPLPVDDGPSTGALPEVGVDVPGEGEVGQLVVVRGPLAGARYALEREVTSVGRHPDSDVFLDDVTVSRRHAEVHRRDDGQYLLTDVGSLNGTYLNNERVESAALREGAQIQVGKFRLVFVIGQLGGSA